jgi:hypothetical protein
MITKDFGKATDVTMDQFWRQMIEAMFDADINEGILDAVINEGKDNETTLKIRLVIVELDGKSLEEDE